MKMRIADMPPGTRFKLGDHVCQRLNGIGRYTQQSDHGDFPIINFTWHDAKFWPGDDEGEIIGHIGPDGKLKEESG